MSDKFEDTDGFLAAYEFSSSDDKREVTLKVTSKDKPFDGLTLQVTFKSFIEAYADDFDYLLESDKTFQ